MALLEVWEAVVPGDGLLGARIPVSLLQGPAVFQVSMGLQGSQARHWQTKHLRTSRDPSRKGRGFVSLMD